MRFRKEPAKFRCISGQVPMMRFVARIHPTSRPDSEAHPMSDSVSLSVGQRKPHRRNAAHRSAPLLVFFVAAVHNDRGDLTARAAQ